MKGFIIVVPPLEEALIELIKEIPAKRRRGINRDEIYSQFSEALGNLILKNRISARDITLKVLIELTDEGKLIDPSSGDRDINIWRWCWGTFLNLGDFISSDRIIEECHLHLLRLQQKNKVRYHKGTPLQTRAEGLINTGRSAKAKKFVILAYIEDIISKQPRAPAWQTLKMYGITERDLRIVEDCTNQLISAKTREQAYYPEEVYQQVQYQLEFGSIGELSKASVFTNPVFLEELLDRVTDAGESDDNAYKRSSLENLAQYLFSSIEGMYVKPSQRAGPYELDGIITNISSHPFLSTLDTYIPIECKNWKDPIGSPEIAQFLGKLGLFKCNYGILLSREGAKDKTVNEVRKDASRRDDTFILIFNKDDIKSLIKEEDLISLLIKKYEELKFSIKM